MVEFSINGNEYRAGKLTAFQQLHVSRKLAGILPKVVPALVAATEAGSDLSSLLTAFGPAAEALAAMPESDVDFVYHTTLAAVSRKQGSAWCAIWNGSAKTLQFDDIDLSIMSQIVFQVLKDSLGSFMQGFLASALAGSPPAA